MIQRTLRFGPTLLLLTLPFFAACGEHAGDTGDGWTGTIDTLAGGTVVVHNPATGVWNSTAHWRLEETLRIGTATGTGPGEFEDPIAMAWGPEEHLWVVDPGNGRYAVFDTGGSIPGDTSGSASTASTASSSAGSRGTRRGSSRAIARSRV